MLQREDSLSARKATFFRRDEGLQREGSTRRARAGSLRREESSQSRVSKVIRSSSVRNAGWVAAQKASKASKWKIPKLVLSAAFAFKTYRFVKMRDEVRTLAEREHIALIEPDTPVPLIKQGDLRLYSNANIVQRERLRNHPKVLMLCSIACSSGILCASSIANNVVSY